MNKRLKDVMEYVIIILSVLLIRTFVATPIRVSGDSMYPTLKDGNIVSVLDNKDYIRRFPNGEKVCL